MSQPYTPPPLATSGTAVRSGLLTVWAVLSLGAAAFVLMIGTNAPYADEWEFVPALVSQEPALPWLWQQHNEHRLPLPRAIFLTLFRLTHDFRAGMLLQVVMLSALALYLMRLAARLRETPHWADSFFPISLLHIGHWENFLMGYQVCFTLFCVLATGLAVIAPRMTPQNAFRRGLAGGVLLMLLALTGGSGLAVIPPVAAWLGFIAFGIWRTGRRGKATLLVLLALLPVAYLVVYFVGYVKPPGHPKLSTNPLEVLRVAGEVLAMSFGIGVAGVWWAVAVSLVALGMATLARLAPLWRQPAERFSVVGLVAVAVGVSGVALAIGVGRGGWGAGMGLWSRYSLLAWPLLALSYLVWVKFGAKWILVGMCVVAALAFPPNTITGMICGASLTTEYAAVEADAVNGATPEQIADAEKRRHERNPQTAVVLQRTRAIHGIPLLRDNNIGIFARTSTIRNEGVWWWVCGGALLALLAAAVGRWVWVLGRAVHVERCRELFRLQHERFEEQLLHAASASGLPRGLRWVRCAITGDAVLVRDTATGGIVALVPVLIDFVPVEGGDMEDVPAAREPRPATAVFSFHTGSWHTAGRVIFNHTPEQSLAVFPELQRLPDHG